MNIRFGGIFASSLVLCVLHLAVNSASGQEKATKAPPRTAADADWLNVILDRLHKYKGISTAFDPLPLSEAVLSHVNVTHAPLGLEILRDGGKGLELPTALQERMSPKQRQDLEKLVQDALKRSEQERLDGKALKDLRKEIIRMGDKLRKDVNEMPTYQYLDAKLFLLDLSELRAAIEGGDALHQRNFQRFVTAGKGSRSIQEVVDYMRKNELRFAPAGPCDGAAYDAVFTALDSFDRIRKLKLGGDVVKIRLQLSTEPKTIKSLFDGIPADLRAMVRDNPVRCDRVNDWLKEHVNGKGKTIEIEMKVKKVRPYRINDKTYRVELTLERPNLAVLGDEWSIYLCDRYVSEDGSLKQDFHFGDVSVADAEKLADAKSVMIRGNVKEARLSRFRYLSVPHTVHFELEDVQVNGSKFVPYQAPDPFGGKKGGGKKGGFGKGQ